MTATEETPVPIEHLELPSWRDSVTVPDIEGRDIDPRRKRFTAYVSGPMTGRKNFNFDTFDEAESLGRAMGWTMVSPAAHDRKLYPDMEKWDGFADGDVSRCPEFNFHKAMVWDLQEVARADAIVLLPGWTKSTGAGHELDVALACGKRIFVTTSTPGQGVQDVADFLEVDAETCTGIRHNAEMVADLNAEHRVVDPETGGEKGQKIAQLGALDPAALLDVARVAGFGGEKYERYNFAKGYAWSLSFDAMQRHLLAFWGGEDTDPESGEPHAAHAAWHCLALLTFLRFSRGTDDRFPLRG